MNTTFIMLFLGLSVITISIFIFLRRKRKAKTIERLTQRWGEASDDYLNMRLVKIYNEQYTKNGFSNKINIQTSNDLDIQQIFEKYNHTHSKIGEQVFWHTLHNPYDNLEDLKQFDELSALLTTDTTKRQLFQKELA